MRYCKGSWGCHLITRVILYLGHCGDIWHAGLGECDYLCLPSPGLQVYCTGRYHRQPSHCSSESSAADRTGEQISPWKLKPHKSAFISYITMRLVKMILVSATALQSWEPPISKIYSFLIQITLNRAVCSALAYVKLSSISTGRHFSFASSNFYFVNKSFKVVGSQTDSLFWVFFITQAFSLLLRHCTHSF